MQRFGRKFDATRDPRKDFVPFRGWDIPRFHGTSRDTLLDAVKHLPTDDIEQYARDSTQFARDCIC